MKHIMGRYFFPFGAAYYFGYACFAAEKCR